MRDIFSGAGRVPGAEVSRGPAPQMRVPFCDLRAAHAWRGEATERALVRVARSGRYVIGPEVNAFESEWAEVCGARHAVGVGSGTDALVLILRAAGIGPGDEVVVPAYTAPATWMAVAWAGASPVGADVDPRSGLIDPVAAAAACGDRTKALVAVHLFGRLAPMDALQEVAQRYRVLLVEDAAQAHGSDEGAGPAGSLGHAAAFSFYPTKTLGALGDAGAVVTGDPALAEAVRRMRSYGWPSWHGDAPAPGGNTRLDELQAAVLREQLAELDGTRRRLSDLGRRLRRGLTGLDGLRLPQVPEGGEEPAWHQFVVSHERREALRYELAHRGVGTALHYDPIPPCLTAFGAAGAFPRAEDLAAGAVSLPFDPWLSDAQADEVCSAVAGASGSSARSCT